MSQVSPLHDMIPRMVINGKAVPPEFLLMKEIDRVSGSMWDLPKDHPDLEMRVKRLDALTLALLKLRRAN